MGAAGSRADLPDPVRPGCGDDSSTNSTEDPPAGVERPALESLNLEFVWIAPGTFTMGSTASEPGHEESESPPHEVTITWVFWLAK